MMAESEDQKKMAEDSATSLAEDVEQLSLNSSQNKEASFDEKISSDIVSADTYDSSSSKPGDVDVDSIELTESSATPITIEAGNSDAKKPEHNETETEGSDVAAEAKVGDIADHEPETVTLTTECDSQDTAPRPAVDDAVSVDTTEPETVTLTAESQHDFEDNDKVADAGDTKTDDESVSEQDESITLPNMEVSSEQVSESNDVGTSKTVFESDNKEPDSDKSSSYQDVQTKTTDIVATSDTKSESTDSGVTSKSETSSTDKLEDKKPIPDEKKGAVDTKDSAKEGSTRSSGASGGSESYASKRPQLKQGGPKSYNTARKLEQDRRDSWRKNERANKKPESGGKSQNAEGKEEGRGGEGHKSDSRSKGDSSSKDSRSSAREDNGYSGRGSRSDSKSHGDGAKSGRSAKYERDKKHGDKEMASPQKGDSTDILKMILKGGDKKTPARSKGSSRGSSSSKGQQGPSVAELEAQWQKEEEQKNKEEEERRKEEERLQKEAEEKKRKEEEEQRLKEEEKKSLQEHIQESRERVAHRESLRQQNMAAVENRPDESFYSKLDSNLKKNTTFVKKLKNLTEAQIDTLVKDFNGLNLSKYIGEAAVALTEAKLKMGDIPAALQICSLLHQRYVEFAPCLMENWNKVLLTKKDDKVPNPSKLRVDLRFFAELVRVGVFSAKEGLPVLANQLHWLMSNDKDEHNNLTIINSFCRHCGDDYAGLLSQKYRLLMEKYEMEIPRSKFLRCERQRACRTLLRDYYQSVCNHLEVDYKALKSMEKHNRKILQTKGELSSERKDRHEAALLQFQKLQQSSTLFADLLDETLPEIPEEELKSDEMGLDVLDPTKAEFQLEGDTSIWEDDDTRCFYENLPDLKAYVPRILYKESEAAGTDNKTGQSAEGKTGQSEEEADDLNVEDVEKEMEAERVQQEIEDMGEKQEEPAPEPVEEQDEDELDICGSMKLMLDAFLQSLPNCVNRELIDRAAMDFCMNLNTKPNRKKLVRSLFTVHRTRYDLLPFYSRLVATLNPCMPDVANELVNLLKGDFKWHIRKKDQINIESKLKTVRFTGELVKFGMFPKQEALHCVKMLMFDFSHHNIEMVCSLLDSCGRYLYRSPDAHHRTKVYLDVMMRKKAALHLDSRYSTMIENAYYYSNPPETKLEDRKVRPPMHEYIRKLLYKDLSKVTTERVLRQMRKLAWDDTDILAYITKCFIGVWNVKYNSIHCVANILAGLTPYHEVVAIRVVDGMLEDIRLGLEINHPKYNQRRVSAVKYLGELYNYRMVESSVIFQTLYLFISFGVSLEAGTQTPLDPPEHLFRIRLVSVVLDTCGQYFDRGSSRKKLDCFLVYFQRYYWFKRTLPIWTVESPFPIDVGYLLRDTIEALRPKLKLASNLEEASKNVEELEKELLAQIADKLPKEGDIDAGMPTITEKEEMMDDLSQGLSQVQMDEAGGSQQDEGGGGGSTQEESELDGDYRTGSQSHSQGRPELQGEDEEENNEMDDDDEDKDDVILSAGEEEDDDQVTVLTGGPKHIKCSEDEDFMTAFDKMMADNLQARSSESLKVPQLDIAVPIQLKSQTKPKIAEGFDEAINFTLMIKRGNKQQFTTLNVPIAAEFASKFREREMADRMEKERMKQVVLDIHERQEEEDYQEMIASLSRVGPVNSNREKRLRYQHPKGAPDADQIFGSKKKKVPTATLR